MREIKFRGKRIDTGEWIYGYFTRNDENGNCYITTQTESGGAHPWQVIPESVGQFIGLRDKNGKEIYEGDILSNGNGKKSVMEWCKNLAAFECEPGDSIIFAPFNWDKCEIIGTIHDQKAEV